MRWIHGTGWVLDGSLSDLYAVSETELHLLTTLPEMRDVGFTAEADAIEEWLGFHGIVRNDVLLGSTVVRDSELRQIRYVSWPYGQPCVEQGEAPPLPFPEILFRHETISGAVTS